MLEYWSWIFDGFEGLVSADLLSYIDAGGENDFSWLHPQLFLLLSRDGDEANGYISIISQYINPDKYSKLHTLLSWLHKILCSDFSFVSTSERTWFNFAYHLMTVTATVLQSYKFL